MPKWNQEELKKLVAPATPEQIIVAVRDYLELIDVLNTLFARQASLDVPALERRHGRTSSDEEREAIVRNQVKGYDWTFIYLGMTDPTFVDVLTRLDVEAARQVAEKARAFA